MDLKELTNTELIALAKANPEFVQDIANMCEKTNNPELFIELYEKLHFDITKRQLLFWRQWVREQTEWSDLLARFIKMRDVMMDLDTIIGRFGDEGIRGAVKHELGHFDLILAGLSLSESGYLEFCRDKFAIRYVMMNNVFNDKRIFAKNREDAIMELEDFTEMVNSDLECDLELD